MDGILQISKQKSCYCRLNVPKTVSDELDINPGSVLSYCVSGSDTLILRVVRRGVR